MMPAKAQLHQLSDRAYGEKLLSHYVKYNQESSSLPGFQDDGRIKRPYSFQAP
jgi:hypothetical protein